MDGFLGPAKPLLNPVPQGRRTGCRHHGPGIAQPCHLVPRSLQGLNDERVVPGRPQVPCVRVRGSPHREIGT